MSTVVPRADLTTVEVVGTGDKRVVKAQVTISSGDGQTRGADQPRQTARSSIRP